MFIDVNEGFEKLFGYKRNEVVGKSILDFNFWRNAEERNRVINAVKRNASIKDYEAVIKTKSGKIRSVLLSIETIEYNGKPHLVTIGRDITERKAEEERNRQHQAQLMHSNKMAMLGTLVSSIAHEINNPNNYIMLNVDLVRRICNDAMSILTKCEHVTEDVSLGGFRFPKALEVLPQLLSGINDGSNNIKKIIDNLRDFVRPKKDHTSYKADINKVFNVAISIMSSKVAHYTEKFEVDFGDNIPLIDGDSQKLTQIVINLISNSLEALPDRHHGIYLSTSFDEESNMVVLRVKDNGTGIAKKAIQNLTEPFYTTKEDSKAVGLGLYISSLIVKEHKGTLDFETEPGKGTTVIVRLPVSRRAGDGQPHTAG